MYTLFCLNGYSSSRAYDAKNTPLSATSRGKDGRTAIRGIKGSTIAVAMSAASNGVLAVRTRSRGRTGEPCVAQRIMGTVSVIIMAEKAVATPTGPYANPMAYDAMTSGAMTNAILRLRSICPLANSSQPTGLINARARIVGARHLKMMVASVHFGPSRTTTISLANIAQLIVSGTVIARNSEYPLRK